MSDKAIISELVLREALDAIPFYAMLLDSNHHILLANKAVIRDLGVAPERIIGGYCPKIVHGLDSPFPGCPLEEAVDESRAVERELFDAKSGRWMRSVVYPVRPHSQERQAIFLHLVHDITEEKRTKDQLMRNYDTRGVLNSLLHLSLEDVSFEELLKSAVGLILSIPWLVLESRGSIFLVEGDSNVLVMKAQNGLAGPIQEACARVPFGRCHCGRAALTGKIQFADCIDDLHEIQYEGITNHGHYCVPILSGDKKVIGVINLYLKEGHPRDESEEEFLTANANVLAGIITRRQAQEVKDQKMRELTALNTMFQQHINMRLQTEEAYKRLVSGIHNMAEEIESLLHQSEKERPPFA